MATEPEAARAAPEHSLADSLSDPALIGLIALLVDQEPGDQVPSERELSIELGVSRTALRDRISRLESLGMLERRERLGTYYAGASPERVSDALVLALMAKRITVDSLVEVRHALERHSAVLASAHGDAQAIERMRQAVERMRASADGRELFEADNDFHRALFEAAGSPALQFFAQMLHAVLRSTLRFVTLAVERDRLRLVHAEILDAVVAGDADAAGEAVDRHFGWLAELIARDGDDPSLLPTASS